MWNKDANLGQKVYKAPNPPQGAVFDYYLKGEQKADVVITVTDEAGKAIRTLRNVPKAIGVNRTTWDLRYDGPQQQGGGGRRALDEEDEGPRFGGAGGPYVLPGDYTVTLNAGGKALTRTVKVSMDPRTEVPMTDLTAQLDAGLALRDLTNRVGTTIDRTNDIITQLTQLTERVKPGGPDAASANAKGVYELATVTVEMLKKLRDEQMLRPVAGLGYRQYPRLREEVQSVYGMVTRPPNRPTDGQALRMKELIRGNRRGRRLAQQDHHRPGGQVEPVAGEHAADQRRPDQVASRGDGPVTGPSPAVYGRRPGPAARRARRPWPGSGRSLPTGRP